MNDVRLPGHITLYLTWSDLNFLLLYLKTALQKQSWLRAVLVFGDNLELCFHLQKSWDQGVEKTPFYADIANGSFPQIKTSHPVSLTDVNCPFAYFTGVEAGFLILSSNFNLMLHLQTSSSLEARNDWNPAFPWEGRLEGWQTSLMFDGQAIAKFLKTPIIAAAVPHCSELTTIDLQNQPQMLRQFWLQLLRLWQNPTSPNHQAVLATGAAVSSSPALARPSGATSFPDPLTILPDESAQRFSPFRQSASPPMDSLNQLLPHAPIGILYQSLDGGILRANATFCQLIGYSEAELRRLDYRAISHPHDLAAEVSLLQQMSQGLQRETTLQKRFFSQKGAT